MIPVNYTTLEQALPDKIFATVGTVHRSTSQNLFTYQIYSTYSTVSTYFTNLL